MFVPYYSTTIRHITKPNTTAALTNQPTQLIEVLRSIRADHPHSLTAVDIIDSDKKDLWDKYKWDIPVLHVNDMYWTKHKLDAKEASGVLGVTREVEFVEPRTREPDADARGRGN